MVQWLARTINYSSLSGFLLKNSTLCPEGQHFRELSPVLSLKTKAGDTQLSVTFFLSVYVEVSALWVFNASISTKPVLLTFIYTTEEP